MPTTNLQTLAHIIYVLSVLALASFSLWDISSITYSFMYDNKMTSVSRMNISDRFPYLQEIRLCLSSKGDYHFPIRVSNESEYFPMIRSAWRDQPIDFPTNMTRFERQIGRNVLKLTLPLIIVPNLDSPLYGTFDQFADRIGMDRKEMEEITDRFLGDPQSIDQMRKYWTEIRPMFIRTDDEDESPADVHVRTWFSWELVCFSIPIDRYLSSENPKSRSKGFLIDLVQLRNFSSGERQIEVPDQFNQPYDQNLDPDPTELTHRPESRQPGFVWILFPTSEEVGIYPSIPQHRTHARIDISHTGTYDGTKFPPCTRDYTTEESCFDDLKTIVYSEVCNCTQFSWALAKLFGDGPAPASIKIHKRLIRLTNFCTKRIYDTCRKSADEEFERRKADALANRDCWPCVVHKLSQSLFTWTNPIDGVLTKEGMTTKQPVDDSIFGKDGWYPRTIIKFRCFDTTYLLFEESHQFSVSQFISQIGGDLGLYIGFSMISVLNLVAYLCMSAWKKTVEKGSVQERLPGEEGGRDGRSWNRMCGKIKRVLGKVVTCMIQDDDQAKALEKLTKRTEMIEQILLELREEVKARKMQ